ncbi:MAG TPA: protein jag [Candidatus Mediterraneibacter norwichensis]|nr:protein jag [Candidatus Mediterraneibacter norwichensis]
MKGSIRVSARTLDDAITEASIQLGVTSDRMEYNVIEKGSAGFLGIGMKQAVIEAWKKEDPEEENQEIFRTFSEEEILKGLKEERPVREKKEKKYKTGKREEKKEERKQPKPEEEKKAAEVKEMPKAEEKKPDPETVSEKEEKNKLAEVEPQTIKAVEAFVADTLKAMNMDVEISSGIDEDGALCVNMKGDHMGILIGKRGQTLDSFQYLANRVANKHQEGYVRVKLDTENYRARREETLKHLAKNIAHKVKRTRRPVSLEPMNPYERRIIHSALQSDPYVTTHSEGEEPYRKVVVTLKR